jgi:dipeptidyl aminopeptidase/acylaminoacyl peptidase
MTKPTIAPYGEWKSPITSDLIVRDTVGLDEIVIDGETIYWRELRPQEGGRYVIVRRRPDGRTEDVTPEGFNARTRVHEYGGGSYLVREGTVYFSNFLDQRLYRQAAGGAPETITEAAALRYADGVFDARQNRIICVREDHRDTTREATNTIVAISVATDDPFQAAPPKQALGSAQVLASGSDFYSSPRLRPDGRVLAFLFWNHPLMPWDGTELRVARVLKEGGLAESELVAGGPAESVVQPLWSPHGELYFISDRSGWWNLYRHRHRSVEAICPKEAEFAGPHWVFGLSSYGFDSARSLLATYTEGGRSCLARVDLRTLSLEELRTPYTTILNVKVGAGFVVLLGARADSMLEIGRLDLATGSCETLRRASEIAIAPGFVSAAEPISFPTEGGLEAHAYYYRPKNENFEAPEGDRPPLLVKSHGGPTSAAKSFLNPLIQYWTSRGFAVLDVDYGGSTGYGREYRERLKGNWGVVDVADCANGARHLVERGEVDGERIAIDGGSAGGYTTLCALTSTNVFRAGASYFGVSDLRHFVDDTHKFEARYLESLVGPFPERKDLYEERSPMEHVDRLSCPVIFLQGSEDKIVPPNQSELMVEALRRKGIPVAYILFAGEQHGFRKAETIKRALEAEFWFFSRVFGFDPADEIEPVEVFNFRDAGREVKARPSQ